jgi:hypothetical protein
VYLTKRSREVVMGQLTYDERQRVFRAREAAAGGTLERLAVAPIPLAQPLASRSHRRRLAAVGLKHEHRAVLELHPEPPRQLQAYGTVVSMPIALEASVRGVSVDNLNQLLVDTES